MPNVFTSTATLPPASHVDTNPGASSRGAGISSTPTFFDHLKLPSGATIGGSSNEHVRAELTRLGIEGAQSDGCNIICARYAAMIQKIHDDAGNAAVAAFLQSKRV